MDAIEAIRYLYQEHKAIASACNRARLAVQRQEHVMPHETLAVEINAALEAKHDPAQFVTLAAAWKVCPK